MANPDSRTHSWQEERGGRIDHFAFPAGPLDDDDRVDEALEETFPASDAPSWNSGLEKTKRRETGS